MTGTERTTMRSVLPKFRRLDSFTPSRFLAQFDRAFSGSVGDAKQTSALIDHEAIDYQVVGGKAQAGGPSDVLDHTTHGTQSSRSVNASQ
jgi:hypothetical protein